MLPLRAASAKRDEVPCAKPSTVPVLLMVSDDTPLPPLYRLVGNPAVRAALLC